VDDRQLLEFAGRLRDVAERFKPQEVAAGMAGCAVSTWQRYLRGEREPGVLTVARFAAAAGVSLEWLITGRAPTSPGTVDQPLLQRLLAEAFEVLDERRIRVKPADIAEGVATIYGIEAAKGQGRDATPPRTEKVAVPSNEVTCFSSARLSAIAHPFRMGGCQWRKVDDGSMTFS